MSTGELQHWEHGETGNRRAGKPWAPGRGKTVGSRERENCGHRGTGSNGSRREPGNVKPWAPASRDHREAGAPGNREHQGARKSWAREKREHQAPLEQGTGSSGQPGTGSTGQLRHRGTGSANITTWHRGLLPGRAPVWGPAPGHGGAWGGSGGVRGTRGSPVTAAPAEGNTRTPHNLCHCNPRRRLQNEDHRGGRDQGADTDLVSGSAGLGWGEGGGNFGGLSPVPPTQGRG